MCHLPGSLRDSDISLSYHNSLARAALSCVYTCSRCPLRAHSEHREGSLGHWVCVIESLVASLVYEEMRWWELSHLPVTESQEYLWDWSSLPPITSVFSSHRHSDLSVTRSLCPFKCLREDDNSHVTLAHENEFLRVLEVAVSVETVARIIQSNGEVNTVYPIPWITPLGYLVTLSLATVPRASVKGCSIICYTL